VDDATSPCRSGEDSGERTVPQENRGSPSCVIRRMRLATAFEVFDEIVGAGLEGSIHARRFGQAEMEFTVTLSLLDRTEQQLAALAGIVEQHKLELDVDERRHASLS
jgi:hypothetical protein